MLWVNDIDKRNIALTGELADSHMHLLCGSPHTILNSIVLNSVLALNFQKARQNLRQLFRQGPSSVQGLTLLPQWLQLHLLAYLLLCNKLIKHAALIARRSRGSRARLGQEQAALVKKHIGSK